jgi:hypothetical protein
MVPKFQARDWFAHVDRVRQYMKAKSTGFAPDQFKLSNQDDFTIDKELYLTNEELALRDKKPKIPTRTITSNTSKFRVFNW